MRDGFIKVAASTPEIRVADVDYNKELIAQGMDQAWKDGIQLLVYPELCLTGYTCGDLFLQEALLQGAEDALRSLLEGSKDLDLLAVVGVPDWRNAYRAMPWLTAVPVTMAMSKKPA